MKGLVLLTILTVAFVAVWACSSEEKDGCYHMFKGMEKDCVKTVKKCARANGIRLRGRKLRIDRLVELYADLSETDQTTLAECVFEKKDIPLEDFNSTLIQDLVIETLSEFDETFAEIASEECEVEGDEVNLMPVFEYFGCLHELCETLDV